MQIKLSTIFKNQDLLSQGMIVKQMIAIIEYEVDDARKIS